MPAKKASETPETPTTEPTASVKLEVNANGVAEEVKGRVDEIRDRLEGVFNDVKDRVDSVVDRVEEAVKDSPFNEFVDHQRKAIDEGRQALASLFPKEAREHGENALKAMLDGYRNLFNASLDEVIKSIERVKVEDKPSEEPAEKK